MDFGAGAERDAETSRRAGTPLYMAPEVLAGQPNTTASDIYAFGVLLFYLVTGDYPLTGAGVEHIRDLHQRDAGKRRILDLRPDVPVWFAHVVNRALAPDPRHRFQTAGEFHDALAAGLHDGGSPSARRRRVVWTIAGAAAVVLLVAAAAAWLRSSPPTTPAVRSIAVLPFVNLTGDSAQEYIADGLTDVLIASLGRIKDLRVVPIPPTSSGQNAETRAQILAGVDVGAFLEGSIQRTGARIRIAVRLVEARARSKSLLWSQVYEGPDVEKFPMQGRIAIDLTRHLGVGPDERTRAAITRYMPSEAVQDAYLRGKFMMASNDRAETPLARAEFERAIALDPAYAPAHAALAQTFLTMGAYGQIPPAEVRQRAAHAAQTAYEIDPTLADSALAMADVKFRVEWDWAGADRAYLIAIDLNPSDAQARSRYARYLAAARRTGEALEEARRAYALDPLSDEMYALVGMMMYYERRHEEAVAHFASRQNDSVARLVGLGRAQSELGRYSEAIAALERAFALSGNDRSIYAELARVCSRGGDVTRGRKILGVLEGQSLLPGDYIAPQDLAYIHAALGEPDDALQRLWEAVDEQAFRLLWLGVDPRVDTLRSDPRFRALLQRLGIPG
jgi:TolB-like protein/tetratricopeptide (TPR) repeat protein